MTIGTVEGYFKWQAQNGKAYPSKYIKEGKGGLKESQAYYAYIEVCEWPLDASEFALDLDELARRYPLPQNWEELLAKKRNEMGSAK